jgi:serine/threonine-protein kinase
VPPPPSSINPDAPEMLDFIVAKALAKSPGDRYASAREMASDLRECRLQVPARSDSSLVLKRTQPSFEPESANDLLILTSPQTRRSDEEPTVPDAAPTLGFSKAFDSMAATSRLLLQSGSSGEFPGISTPIPPNLGQQGFRRGMVEGWSQKDKLVFVASVIGAVVLGTFIVFS